MVDEATADPGLFAAPVIDAARARPLEVLPSYALTCEQRRVFTVLEAADLWFVEERLGKDEPEVTAESHRSAIFEFRRFFALRALTSSRLAMLSEGVDAVWHAFLLFTREYAAFCQAAFGAHVHHMPRTSREGPTRRDAREFMRQYTRAFGPPGPPLWPTHEQMRARGVDRLMPGELDHLLDGLTIAPRADGQ